MIIIIPIKGNKIIESVIPIEIKSSIIEKIGLKHPPVNTEDKPLIPTVANWNPPVIKTPLITDNIHCKPGSKLDRQEEDNTVPAAIEVGVAKTSNKLSSQGIRFAQISTIEAKASTAITHSLPIQVHPSSSWTKSAL